MGVRKEEERSARKCLPHNQTQFFKRYRRKQLVLERDVREVVSSEDTMYVCTRACTHVYAFTSSEIKQKGGIQKF